jgi:class 3 adenylate cyclase
MVLKPEMLSAVLIGTGLGGPRKPTKLVIVFTDFSGFKHVPTRVSDAEIADTMDDYYRLVASVVEHAKGRVVKFIGDAALIVFPGGKPDEALRAILTLRTESDRFMVDRDWDCRFHAKMHIGHVIAGDFGPKSGKRYDIMGREVNATAMLKGDGVGGILMSDPMRAAVSPAMIEKLKA